MLIGETIYYTENKNYSFVLLSEKIFLNLKTMDAICAL